MFCCLDLTTDWTWTLDFCVKVLQSSPWDSGVVNTWVSFNYINMQCKEKHFKIVSQKLNFIFFSWNAVIFCWTMSWHSKSSRTLKLRQLNKIQFFLILLFTPLHKHTCQNIIFTLITLYQSFSLVLGWCCLFYHIMIIKELMHQICMRFLLYLCFLQMLLDASWCCMLTAVQQECRQREWKLTSCS